MLIAICCVSPISQSVSPPLIHSAGLPVSQSAGESVCQWASLQVSQSAGESPAGKSVHLASEWVRQLATETMDNGAISYRLSQLTDKTITNFASLLFHMSQWNVLELCPLNTRQSLDTYVIGASRWNFCFIYFLLFIIHVMFCHIYSNISI